MMNRKKSRLLSKSRYLKGLQCPRLLWVDANDRGRIAYDESTRFVMTQGQEVGLLAQSLFPDGVDAASEDYKENLAKTRQLLSRRLPIFEAGLTAGSLYCRVDILRPAGYEEWDIIEVKSTNSVKREHLNDLAFQRRCAEAAGLTVNRCFLMHLDRNYVKQGSIDPAALFIIEDVTDDLDEYASGLDERIDEMLEVMSSPFSPEAIIGSRCTSPYECPLMAECWEELPRHHPMTLYYGKALGEKLLLQGITHLKDLPPGTRLNGKQQIQCAAIASNQPHVDAAAIGAFLERLEYPLYFMDFETFQTAVPLYDGTSPYQQIPFQFSVHLVDSPGAEPRHFSFLADSPDDPRPRFIKELTECLGHSGSVLVYHESFEKGRLEELRLAFPEYSEQIDNILYRIVDLIVPFKSFHYYHPSQCGKASLKNVMPALAGLDYSELQIQEGGTASLRYYQSVFGELSPEEVAEIRHNLEAYCGQDTYGMIGMVDGLRGLVDFKAKTITLKKTL